MSYTVKSMASSWITMVCIVGSLWRKGKFMSYYVYFIQPEGNGNRPVKIGYSSNPENRCRDLQTSNPGKLKVCVKLPFDTEAEAREAERTLQSLAGKKHRRMNGEWFVLYGSWKKFIAQAMKIYDGNQASKC